MATTCIKGIDGSVTLPTHKIKSRAWSLEVIQEVNDCTGFTSTGDWRENLSGLKSFRGSVSGYVEHDGATTALAASGPVTSGSFTLTLGGTTAYTFTGIVSNVRVGTSIDGNATASLDFVGTGALTETWDETA